MSTPEFILDSVPDADALRATVAQVMGVHPGEVGVVQSGGAVLHSGGPTSKRWPVCVMLAPTSGDFVLYVDVATREDLREFTLSDLTQLCVLLNASAFAFDESDNPYTGFLVSRSGHVRAAVLQDTDSDQDVRLEPL